MTRADTDTPPTRPADAPLFIGVDVGTSVAKAAAFDHTGEAIAMASRQVPLLHPAPGHVEQDPEVIVGSVRAVLTEVVHQLGGRAPRFVAITAQGDGCWLFDESGVPVRPGISWMDARGAAILGEWAENGIPEQVFDINGNIMFPGAPAPILAWLDRNEPASLDAAVTAGYVKDLLLQRFTGVRATDASDASLPFASLEPGTDYSTKILELTGLAHRADLLAPIARPLPFGELTGRGTSGTALAAGTPIVSAPFDIPSCAIGAGVATVGDGLMIAGTTLACGVLTDRADTTGPRAGMTLAMPDEGRWLRVMAAMVGTASMDWIMKTLDIGFDQLERTLTDSVPGANGVEVLPYFAPSGERAPFVDTAARAQLGGLNLTTTKADMVRGVCEGLAYAARHCFESSGLTGKVYVCGGGSKSRSWLQIFASVLDRPLLLARAGEVGARGAVIAGAQTLGIELDVAAWTEPQALIMPVAAEVDLYEAGYRRYLANLEAARANWRR